MSGERVGRNLRRRLFQHLKNREINRVKTDNMGNASDEQRNNLPKLLQ